MKVKAGVKFAGVQPEIVLALLVAETCLEHYGYELVVTSITDGTHGADSLHYKGRAFDARTRHMVPSDIKRVAEALRLALGSEFEVVVEQTHIHVEFDPKS